MVKRMCVSPGAHHEFEWSKFFIESQGQATPRVCREHLGLEAGAKPSGAHPVGDTFLSRITSEAAPTRDVPPPSFAPVRSETPAAAYTMPIYPGREHFSSASTLRKNPAAMPTVVELPKPDAYSEPKIPAPSSPVEKRGFWSKFTLGKKKSTLLKPKRSSLFSKA